MMQDRTARIQAQLDEAAAAKAGAEEAATSIRAAKGDIDAERQRMLADEDAAGGPPRDRRPARLDQEVAELMAKAESEIDSVQGRLQSEVQAEVAELAAHATEQVVGQSLDDELQQQLVEDFIARVGAAS